MKRIINWGIIGTGNIATSFASDFVYASEGVIKAVASRSHQKAIEFAGKFGVEKPYGNYHELLADTDIDVIYIATPHTCHFDQALEAMKAGKAVLCEKPLTTDPDSCRRLIEFSRQSNQYLMEALWTYFLPAIKKALDWINEGLIGEIRHIKADFAFQAPYDPVSRLYNPKLAGGALMDIGIYPISLVWMIMKKMPDKIMVSGKKAPTGVDMQEAMYLEYDNGITADLFASFAFELPNEARIAGSEGYIRIPDFFKAKECFLYRQGALISHFEDTRKSTGYNFEIDAVNADLKSNRTESDIVAHTDSLRIQEILELVKAHLS